MIVDYLDDDENVKMMRDTARRVGLTDLLVSIRALNRDQPDSDILRSQIAAAVELLGSERREPGEG